MSDIKIEDGSKKYEEAHGIRGLEYVLKYTVASEWEFHTLTGYVPYSVWKDSWILIVNVDGMKFRRLKKEK